MIYFFLAFRNVLGNLKKNLFAVVTIAAGLTGLFIFLGYIQNTVDNFREFTIQSGMGHLVVSSSDDYFRFGESAPFQFEIQNSELIIEEIRNWPEVYAVTPSLHFSSMISFGDKTINATVKSYIPEIISLPEEMSSQVERGPFFFGRKVSGSGWLDLPGNQIILGLGMAEILNIKVGQSITMVAILADGTVNAADFIVAGIYESPTTDKFLCVTRYNDASQLLGQSSPSAISILLKNTVDTNFVHEKVLQYLNKKFPELRVQTWVNLAEYFGQVQQMFTSFFVIIATLIIIVTVFSTVNTLNMSVWSRLREFGTMRIVGTLESRVIWIIFLEGCTVGFVGVLCGVITGYIASFTIDGLGGIPLVFQSQVLMMKTTVHLSSVPWLFLTFTLISGLSAIIPGIRAISQSPGQNLREI